MRKLLVAAALLMLAGCATSPHTTVSQLNHRDPEYRTRDCRQARAAVARYDDNKDGRAVIAIAGTLVVPFAGALGAAIYDNRVHALSAERLGSLRQEFVEDMRRGVRGFRRTPCAASGWRGASSSSAA